MRVIIKMNPNTIDDELKSIWVILKHIGGQADIFDPVFVEVVGISRGSLTTSVVV